MNVFVDGIIFARQRHGGVSTVWREYLKRLPDYGVDVRLLLPPSYGSDGASTLLGDRARHRVIRDHFSWPRRFFERASVRSTLMRRHLDASVQLFQSTYFSTVYRTPIPKVVMLYDMILERPESGPPHKWTEWGIAIKRAALHNADHIVAISQSTRNDLLEIYQGISPEKVTVIPLAAEVPAVPTIPNPLSFTEVARKHGLDLEAGAYLLYVGARHGYKNYRLIVDLLRHRPGTRDLRVVCVGGEDHQQDRAGLASLGFDRNVRFVECVGRDELSVLYRNALALIYPSRYEGFGLPVLEAMAEGCPVLCSDAASLPEVGGDACFYFNPDSVESLEFALTRLLSGSRDEIVDRGLRNVARFSWDRSTRALVDLYRGLADGATSIMNFSIVTPSLRQPEWLRLCLGSVADQAAGAGETDGLPGAGVAVTVDHVVQDACSGEPVRAVCAEFPSVRLFQERDGGMYDAVNRGWRRGTGEICAYLNCDEQYLPGTLAAVASYFREHPEIDLVFGDVIVVDATGQYVCSRRVLVPHKYHTQVCQLNTFTAAMFVRRRILDDPSGYFDIKWRNSGDAVWVLTMIERGVRMAVLRRYLSIFTDTGANMNLNEEGRQEFANLRRSAAWWVRGLAPLWVAQHRARRLVHGLYERRPLEYCIYTAVAPKQRARFEVEKSTPIWRDRLAWTR